MRWLAATVAVSVVALAVNAAAQGGAPRHKKATKAAALTPLSERDRVVQVLDRFSYGARPGEVDRVLAGGGAEAWFEAQLNPAVLADNAWNRRANDWPTLRMQTADQLVEFPTTGYVRDVYEKKQAGPTDPNLKAVYETLLWRWDQQQTAKQMGPDGKPKEPPTTEELAEQKSRDKATAARVAGELLALPKDKRMAALFAMAPEERAAFTTDGNLAPQERNLLMADFTPKEREYIYAMAANVQSSYRGRAEMGEARLVRDTVTNRQLEQVMTNFWFNHFNVYMPKDADEWYTTSYERDVIRPHALGKFKDLLLATAQSPAMMVYLDNWLSIGPDSLANGVNPKNPKAKRGGRGLNENYGREVMELHTVGVNGGYSQADVTALSAILTGWTVDQPNRAGEFRFDFRRHEPGPKYWLGYRIDEDGTATKVEGAMPKQTFGPSDAVATDASVKQGIAALNILASSPQTAHFISWKLAQYFVADKPPAALVDRLAKVYLETDGDIKELLRALMRSPEFNSQQYFHNKVKTPEEFVASAFRATETNPDNPGQMANTVREMGEPLYMKLEPTGYYITADQWMSSKALIDRLNFAYLLTRGGYGGQKFDAPKLVAVGLMSPGSTGELSAVAKASPARAKASGAKLIGWDGAGAAAPAAAVPTEGAQVTMRLLERTVIGGPVSGETNRLIAKQLAEQPATANPVETLNLLTALVLGSPEFQSR